MQQRKDVGVAASLLATLSADFHFGTVPHHRAGERQTETDVAISFREDSDRDGKTEREERERRGRVGEGNRGVKSDWRFCARPEDVINQLQGRDGLIDIKRLFKNWSSC